MKHITIILCALCLTVNSFAQGEDEDTSTILKTTFGIKAGYNAIQMKIEN